MVDISCATTCFKTTGTLTHPPSPPIKPTKYTNSFVPNTNIVETMLRAGKCGRLHAWRARTWPSLEHRVPTGPHAKRKKRAEGFAANEHTGVDAFAPKRPEERRPRIGGVSVWRCVILQRGVPSRIIGVVVETNYHPPRGAASPSSPSSFSFSLLRRRARQSEAGLTGGVKERKRGAEQTKKNRRRRVKKALALAWTGKTATSQACLFCRPASGGSHRTHEAAHTVSVLCGGALYRLSGRPSRKHPRTFSLQRGVRRARAVRCAAAHSAV